MYKETNKRSLVKGVTWRIVATTTTMVIVYVFFGRLDLAIATGLLESVLKIGLFGCTKKHGLRYAGGKKE